MVAIDVNDDVALLHLSQGFAVSKVEVAPGDWIGGEDLAGLALRNEGVFVMGI